METKRVYQEVVPSDREESVELTIGVDDLKYLYNLLVDQYPNMVGYKQLQEMILQVLKDHKFDKELNDLPF